MMKSSLGLLVLIAVLSVSSGQNNTCDDTGGDIGDDRYMQERIPRDRPNFYLNIADPASCSGTINSFSYCYVRQVISGATSYVFTFAVYRESSPGSGVYNIVSPVFVVERTLSDVVNGENFTCINYSVNDTVPVETGDVLGACIYDPPGDVVQLDIVGRIRNISRNGLFFGGLSLCGNNSVPSSVTFDAENVSVRRILHLYANIGGTTTTGAGGTGAIAAAVVIVLIILIVSIVTTVILFVFFTKKHSLPKRAYSVRNPIGIQDGIDNVVYSSENTGSRDGKAAITEYAEVSSRAAAKPLDQSEAHYEFDEVEHTYEYESFSNSATMNEYAYAEVGPYKEGNHGKSNASVYSLPLNEPISYSKLLEKNKEEDIYGNENPFRVPASQEDEIYAQLKTWGVQTISLKDVEVVGHLGSGQFGSVERGVWKRHGTKPVEVALKSLNKESSEDKLKFLQEAAIMAQFRHLNVILLHGVVTRGDPMMLVVEMAMRGDLRELLLSMRPDPGELVPGKIPSMFLSFSQQVALGMQYLSAKGFVHRDLAARNVLVSTANVCKVADFGMSRDLADENYYVSHGGQVPVKWTAPEAIHYKKYSTASDVWAYGCLLYEIWSVGYKPFEGTPNVKVVRRVDSGERLSPPPGCPKMIYELMILCWHPETSLRPAFRDIVLTLVGSEQMVLNIPEEDSSTNPLAGVLGAPLEAGENMYTNLQKRYIN